MNDVVALSLTFLLFALVVVITAVIVVMIILKDKEDVKD